MDIVRVLASGTPALPVLSLHQLLDDVAAGSIPSAMLLSDPTTYRAYTIGYSKAVVACEARICELKEQLTRFEFELDHWYEKVHNSGRQLVEVRQRSLDQAWTDAFYAGSLRTILDDVETAVAAVLPRRRAA